MKNPNISELSLKTLGYEVITKIMYVDVIVVNVKLDLV